MFIKNAFFNDSQILCQRIKLERMNKVIIYSCCLILFLFQLNFIAAQENTVIRVFVSEKVETFNGKKFYLHTVEKGQTLYSIAVAYNKPLVAIARENKIENNLISIGQILRIPVDVDPADLMVPEKVIKNDNVYHDVKKGETLIGISKKYNVPIAELEKMNPILKDGLKIGQKIIVSQKTAKNEVVEPKIKEAAKDTTQDYIIHIVQKKETLFSISNKYVVPIKSILALNPEAEKGIKPKMNLKIPTSVKFDLEETPKPKKDTVIIVLKDTIPQLIKNISCPPNKQKKTLEIALLVPFYLNEVNEINTDFSSHTYQVRKTNIRSFTYIQFYQGFVLALDSLKKTGLSVKLHVFDITEDIQSARNFIGKPEMKKLDFIVGPFFAEPFKIVANFAKDNNIMIINPVVTDTKSLPASNNLFNIALSPDLQLERYVSYLYKKHADKNIIIVHNNTPNEKSISSLLKSYWSSIVGADSLKFPYTEVLYNQTGLTSVINNISSAKTNFILCLSNNEAFISNFIRKISEIQKDSSIALFGLPSWQKFNNIELAYLQTLNYHYFTTDYINYQDSVTDEFIAKFRQKYEIEPDEYAFSGYDIAQFFLSSLNMYGPQFTQCINNIEYHPVGYGYNFRYNNTSKSFDNTRLAFLKYIDFLVQEDK